MKQVKHFAVILAALSIFAALLPLSNAMAAGKPAAGSKSWSCYQFTHAERAFARRTNRARTAHGLHKLALDPQLSKTSSVHTSSMVTKKLLFHTTNSQFYARVTNWSMLGENVGEGGGIVALQKAFMHSPEHRANILHKGYGHIGVGVAKKNGTMWVTVQFEAGHNPGTTLSKPTC